MLEDVSNMYKYVYNFLENGDFNHDYSIGHLYGTLTRFTKSIRYVLLF